MKILAFVDTHGNDAALKRVIEKSRIADIIVCLGDFTIFENDMFEILAKLDNIGKPVIILHGNHESPSALMHAVQKYHNIRFIHKGFLAIDDLIFFGYGGGGFAIEDKAFTKAAEAFIDHYTKNKMTNKIILCTHQPPFGTRLDDLGYHVGNQSMTKFIIEHQPFIALAGHIHECSGAEDKINKTRLLNPGPEGKIIDV